MEIGFEFDSCFLKYRYDIYPVHFQLTVPFWLRVPIKKFQYPSLPLPPYTQFFELYKLSSKVLCLMDAYEYSWKGKAFNFHSLFFEST